MLFYMYYKMMQYLINKQTENINVLTYQCEVIMCYCLWQKCSATEQSVSGVTFMRYAQNRKIGKPNNCS
jgi:hypothetical protein